MGPPSPGCPAHSYHFTKPHLRPQVIRSPIWPSLTLVLLKRHRTRAAQRVRPTRWMQPWPYPLTFHTHPFPYGNSPTSSSVCRQVPGPSKGATMLLVTGSLLGKLERQWSMTGLTPFRYWYPKKQSSYQCSVTYSRRQEREAGRTENYFSRSCFCPAFCSSLWLRSKRWCDLLS